ncbi:MAG: YraN family protein [Oscillospiraceae bacterium]|nr:YraN family protein [Oscillospiraceae bacterium]
MDRQELGRYGEDCAVRYLRRKGYTILERNFRCRQGEIDIIATRRGYVVFAEVKLRKDDSVAAAREFVTRAKQERILTTAMIWLGRNDCALQPRFDVIEVYAPNGKRGPVTIEHLEDAFS